MIPVNKYLERLIETASSLRLDLYLVGGTVRDHFLGKVCSDFDFTAKNVQTLAKRFASETQSPCIPLDNTPDRETLRVVVQKQLHFDFTDMQGQFIEDDLRQRDFSINAMAMRPRDFLQGKKNLIDPNRGLDDLKNKIIRVVPGSTFTNDPLRMLRAFRFASTLGFNISPETIHQIEIDKSKLEQTALERVYYEWVLFLSGEGVFELLQQMARTGFQQYVIPETMELRQSSGVHASVWETGLQTFKKLEDLLSIPKTMIPLPDHAGFLTGRKRALLRFSTLLHGFAPPFSRKACDSKIKIDENSTTVRLLKRLTASNADIRFIFKVIHCQQEVRGSYPEFAQTTCSDSMMYHFSKKYGEELTAGIFLACAVQSASSEKTREKESFFQAVYPLVEFYFQRYLPAMEHKPLITGDDLIRQFKISPSPLFQPILDKVEEERVLGTIKTQKQATAIAQKIIATHNTEQET